MCKRKVTGKVIDTVTESTSGDRSIKVKYVYNVKNEKYEGCTSWRNYGKYIIGGDILVKYNDKNPQESYLPGIDMVIKIMVGFLFAIVGCGVVLIGVLLKM